MEKFDSFDNFEIKLTNFANMKLQMSLIKRLMETGLSCCWMVLPFYPTKYLNKVSHKIRMRIAEKTDFWFLDRSGVIVLRGKMQKHFVGKRTQYLGIFSELIEI